MLPDDWQEQDVVELGTLLLSPQVGVPSRMRRFNQISVY